MSAAAPISDTLSSTITRAVDRLVRQLIVDTAGRDSWPDGWDETWDRLTVPLDARILDAVRACRPAERVRDVVAG